MTSLRLSHPVAYRQSSFTPPPLARDGSARTSGASRSATEPDRSASEAVQSGSEAGRWLAALRPSVLRAITAERARAYVEILGALLALRRRHELAPLVDDLWRAASEGSPELAWGTDSSEECFARDLAQLEEWGCVERQLEPLRIRGYKDARRERFRYRLTEDAVAMLSWLEAHAHARDRAVRTDGRDRLADVLGQLRELRRVSERVADGMAEPAEEPTRGTSADPRRAVHLSLLIDDGIDAIADELVAFRGEMLLFARSTYDATQLVRILGWLERYVTTYVSGISALAAEIEAELDASSEARTLAALDRCRAVLEAERSEAPASLRGMPLALAPDEQLGAWKAFFRGGGRLSILCEQVESSAREVLRKMHAHLRVIERRSARRDDLARALTAVSEANATREQLALWTARLLGFTEAVWAHGAEGGRRAPPLPRRHGVEPSRPPPILPEKRVGATAAHELTNARHRELASWVERVVLAGGSAPVRLSDAVLDGPDAARAWIRVARARHLGRGRGLSQLGVRITDAPGVAIVGDESSGLEAPNCVVERRVSARVVDPRIVGALVGAP